jgi:predicted DNA-binding transcriptional regulator YafY
MYSIRMVIGSKRIPDRAGNLRWGIERRLEFVEFRLYWEGYVNRSDLSDVFGVSAQQASTDLNRYLDLAPDNMRYDKSAKRYVRTEQFKPVFMVPDSVRYLAQLHLVASGVLEPLETWLPEIPYFDSVPFPRRNINPEHLRGVLEAIKTESALETLYQSLSKPEPIWRWISPTALGFDGFRWHVRAWCHIDKVYKDFLLPRILDTRNTKVDETSRPIDEEWEDIVSVKVAPNPLFSDGQKAVIELDYGMENGVLEVKVRQALLYYVLKRLGLDRDPESVPAREQHIVLMDRENILRRTPIASTREGSEA